MISIDRNITLKFEGDDAWELTQLAKYVIEVIQTGTSQGYGYDAETIEGFKKLAYRLADAIPNEGFL